MIASQEHSKSDTVGGSLSHAAQGSFQQLAPRFEPKSGAAFGKRIWVESTHDGSMGLCIL